MVFISPFFGPHETHRKEQGGEKGGADGKPQDLACGIAQGFLCELAAQKKTDHEKSHVGDNVETIRKDVRDEIQELLADQDPEEQQQRDPRQKGAPSQRRRQQSKQQNAADGQQEIR